MLNVRMHADCALFRAGKCACMRGNVDKQAALKRIAKLDLELQIAVMEALTRIRKATWLAKEPLNCQKNSTNMAIQSD